MACRNMHLCHFCRAINFCYVHYDSEHLSDQEVTSTMNCNNCGWLLPPGVASCPSCNAATPYNTTGQNIASPYDPTVAANFGNLPSAPGSGQANPYNNPPQNPYTSYGVGTPPDPYGNTPSYGEGAQPAQNFYTPPSNPQSGPAPYGYGASGTLAPGFVPGMQPGGYGIATPPKRRSRVGLIVGISLLAFVLLCGGLIALFAVIGKNAASSISSPTSVATPAATTSASGVPSSNDVVPSAAKILFNPQMSSA